MIQTECDRKPAEYARAPEMALNDRDRLAVLALPAAADEVSDPAVRRWLAQARFRQSDTRDELLPRVLSALDLPPPDGGIAALRLWGQTGERPAARVAAADPVYLEARLDHVRLHALPQEELPAADVSALFGLLQAALGSGPDRPYAFTSIGALGYLQSERPFATAAVSPALADGESPDLFLPEGDGGHDRLASEVQMCLFEAAINRRREAAGARPVNALWFWGGGTAPPRVARDLPVLFANDPVLSGYWRSSSAREHDWPGSLSACCDAAGAGFVAAVPGRGAPDACLTELHSLLAVGRLRQAVLLFRDGSSATMRRTDRFRFWRR
jgi:hypothetical protein